VSETIVSDDSTTPEVRELVHREFPEVVFVEGPRRGLGANRNRALEVVTSSHVLFLDDDAQLGSTFIEEIQGCLATRVDSKRQTTIVTGVVVEEAGTWRPGEQSFLGHQNVPFPVDVPLTNVAMPSAVFPRRLFGTIRFDESLIYGYDEIDLTSRAVKLGYEIILCKSAINTHAKSAINRDYYAPHQEASRLYATFKRYLLTERRMGLAFAFAVVAPVHALAVAVRRQGVRRGLPAWGNTMMSALRSLRGLRTAGPLAQLGREAPRK
jgi:GT2 family glycosyltransferase